MSDGDREIYDFSLDGDKADRPFEAHQVNQIYDLNNGVYNNQIIFSTKGQLGTNLYVDLRNSYIEVPFYISMKSSVNIAGADVTNAFMAGLKNGSHQIIDSLILRYAGANVAQTSNYSNMMINYKLLSSWTQEDLYKYGDKLMFSPDGSTSMRFSYEVASAFGDGLSNNVITPVASPTAPTTTNWSGNQQGYNEGLLRRLQLASFTQAGYNGVNTMTNAYLQQTGRNRFYDDQGVGAARVYYWQILLTLRLKDVHDFFAQLPLLPSTAEVELIINFNSCYGIINNVIGTTGPATDGTLVTNSYTQVSGNCNPIMVTGASVTGSTTLRGTSPWANVPSGSVTIGCGINGTSNPSLASGLGTFSNCRWYVAMYNVAPNYLENMLSVEKIKTIEYEDFYTFASIRNVTGTFSQVIASGVTNPKYLVMIPYWNNAKASSGNAQSNAQYQSFFDSAPGTTAPVVLTNLQVSLGGTNLFPFVEDYDFQQYMDEFSAINSIGGGKANVECSGLITNLMWSSNYRYYVCDLSRRQPSLDTQTFSVQVTAKVASNNPTGTTANNIDLLCFVVYGRSVKINLVTGTLEYLST